MIDVKNRVVLVVGLGVSGYAASKLLASRGAQVKVSESSDSEEIRNRLDVISKLGVKSEIGKHTEAFFEDADIIVVSPGIDASALPVSSQKDVTLIGEMELAFQYSPAPIIAVTGTNGKSTTTELIGNIISASGKHAVVCGNIGNPLTEEVDRLTADSVAVVEVSSFQLETIKDFKPFIAVLLNVTEDHYDRHGDFERYKAEKFNVFRNQDAEDWAVLHSDFRGDEMLAGKPPRTIFFGDALASAKVEDGKVVAGLTGKDVLMLCKDEIPLEGTHNLDNVACCVLVAKIMGVEDTYIRKGIATFKGLSHRFERVGVFGGVEFIDDSKATNIDATKRALESVEKKVVVIAGGRDKGGDYLSILPVVKEKVKTMVLLGEARQRIKEAFSGSVPLVEAGTMGDAVKMASQAAEKGGTVILSPMCSSFDMYSSYKERGDVFQREIKELFPEEL